MYAMPKNIKLTKDVVEAFNELCRTGLTQKEAAKRVGFKTESIRIACRRMGIKIVTTNSAVVDAIKERREEIVNSTERHAYWAKEFNTSRAYISCLFKKLGITKERRAVHKGENHPDKLAVARKVMGYIAENGGNVVKALKALGIETSDKQYIRNFAKSVGFDFYNYLFAWQQYGEWLTIPGPVTHLEIPQNIMVPAICTVCCNELQLNLTNARTGRTSKCIGCAHKNRRSLKVIDTDTGETFKSIMTFCRVKKAFNKYQTIRVKLLVNGRYELNGVTYELEGGPRKA